MAQQKQKTPLQPEPTSMPDIGNDVKSVQTRPPGLGAEGTHGNVAAVQSDPPASALNGALQDIPLRTEPLQAMASVQQTAAPTPKPSHPVLEKQEASQEPATVAPNPPIHLVSRGQPSQAPAPAQVLSRIGGQTITGQVIDISLQPGQGVWAATSLEPGAVNRTQEQILQLSLQLQNVASNTSGPPRSVRTGPDPNAPILPRSSLALESVPATGARHPSAPHKNGAANLAAAAAPITGLVGSPDSVSNFQTLDSGFIRTVPYGAVTSNELWFDGPPPAGDASVIYALSNAPCSNTFS